MEPCYGKLPILFPYFLYLKIWEARMGSLSQGGPMSLGVKGITFFISGKRSLNKSLASPNFNFGGGIWGVEQISHGFPCKVGPLQVINGVITPINGRR